jgi:heme o synthase
MLNSVTKQFSLYFSLTKPRMVLGNCIIAVAGFLFGSHVPIESRALLIMILGLALVIASACLFNNVIDRDMDARMERTKTRALARGIVSKNIALMLGTLLGVMGILLLLYVQTAAAAVAAVGFFFYVIAYSLWGKRESVYGVLLGGVAGATPPVVGYAAATGQLDVAAFILFLILFFWQVPHFYAIAIRRFNDYAAASIPTAVHERGSTSAKRDMLMYIVFFAAAAVSLTYLGYAGWWYFGLMLLGSSTWFVLGMRGPWVKDEIPWARQMFLYSLFVLLLFSCLLALHPFVPLI